MPGVPKRRPELALELLHALVVLDDDTPTTLAELAEALELRTRLSRTWRVTTGDQLRSLERRGLVCRRTIREASGWMPRHPGAEQELARIEATRARLQEKGLLQCRTVEQSQQDSQRVERRATA